MSASKFVPVIDPSRSLLNFFKRKAVEGVDCLASTSAVDNLSPTRLPAETVKSSSEPVAENGDFSFFQDSTDSFFCSYFGRSVVSSTNESTEEISSVPKEANIEEQSEQDESTELDTFLPMERCPDCDRLVAIIDIPEHADFHAARKLHQELNGMPTERISVAPNTTVTVAANKIARSWTHSSATRGKNKKLVRLKSDPAAAKNQPITHFFQTKQHPQ